MRASKSAAAALSQLAERFRDGGYVRRRDPVRTEEEGRLYKKGAEVRFVARSQAELRDIRRLLRQAGFPVKHAFKKNNQWRQPLYGVKAVARFLAAVESQE